MRMYVDIVGNAYNRTESGAFVQCNRCGAVVSNSDLHDEWHEKQRKLANTVDTLSRPLSGGLTTERSDELEQATSTNSTP